MWPAYDDIIERAGKPDWYSDSGVPRYGEFKPDLCSVYGRHIAYLEIACQNCGERFRVASAISMMTLDPKMPTADAIESFHYGDPPRHGCIGDTMNVDTLRVIEFWSRGYLEEEPYTGWTRRPELEFTYPDGQWGNSNEGSET
mgnify:CR=1 FL=1